ncbi:AsmA family protein [Asaia bogorensis]|uniref:AsmA family protein n=1 Tax=Asaia bogorensis TaxID=91915 RepID=UPI000EFA4C1B|nr:AsmA family protein [Asaia bogorensis]
MKRLTAALIVILVLAAGLAVTAHILIDRSSLKEDVIAAVKRQTGRDLAMARFSVGVLPWPSFSAYQVTLSDEGGDGVTPMLRARDIRASIALIPLLWREIRLENLTVMRGAAILHRDESGQANWVFHPPSGKTGASSGHVSRPQARWKLQIGSAKLDNIRISLDDRQGHHGGTLSVERAEFDGLSSPSPYLDVHGRRGDVPFRVNGHIGPLSLFQGSNPPWAVSLGATLGNDGKQQDWLNFDGQITDMRHFHGFSGVLRGELASLKDVESLFPHANLPDVKGLGGEIGVFDADPQTEEAGLGLSRLGINHVHLHADSSPTWRGLTFSAAHVDADTLSSALAVSAVVNGDVISDLASGIALQGRFGTLAQAGAAWQSGLATPLPVAVDLRDAAKIGTGTGLTAHLSGQIGADESALSLEGQARTLDVMQAMLHDVALKGEVQRDASGSIQIKGLTLTSHEATGVIDASVKAPLPSAIEGTVRFSALDLDALKDLWLGRRHDKTGEAAQTAAPSGSGAAEASSPASTAAPSVQMPIAGQVGASGHSAVIPHPAGMSAVPTDVADKAGSTTGLQRFIDRGQASIDVSVAKLRFNGDDYSDVSGHIALNNAKLAIDSIKGSGNGMTLAGRAVYDRSGSPASVSVVFSPVLFPATLAQTLLSIPDLFHGPLMLVGELDARGETRAAMRDTLQGHLGLSMVGGTIDTSRLGAYLGDAARSLLSHRELPVRCLGLHARFEGGQAQLDTIGMEAGALTLSGHGVYGLADEMLDLHLVPRIGFGGTGASTPVLVKGTLEAPKASQEATVGGRFQLTIGGSQPDTCPDILSAARENTSGEAAPERKKHSQASELLHGLGILH